MGAIDLDAAGVAADFTLATFAAAGALLAGFFAAAVIGFAVFGAGAIVGLAGVALVVATLAALAGAICEAGFVPLFATAVAGLATAVEGFIAGFAVPCAQAVVAASTRTEIVFVAFIKITSYFAGVPDLAGVAAGAGAS